MAWPTAAMAYGSALAPSAGWRSCATRGWAVCARWLILLLGRQHSARPGGLGADFALGLRPAALIAPAVLLLVVTAVGGLRTLAAVAVAHAVAWLIWQAARRRLGGVTGDILGLTVELSELAVLLVYAARLA